MGSAQGQGTSELEEARTAPEFGAHTPLSEKLLAVAIRAQNFTGSTGVAIALTEGQEMVCRANWGTSAPEVGATLSIEHSFTGLCVRTGEPLRCDDAQSDPRVDPEACQALGISAIAAAPIRRGLKVIGVIAAFSDTPNAFTDKHLLILTTLSDVIVEIVDDPHPVQSLPQTIETAPDLARAAAVAQAPLTLSLDKAAVTAEVLEPPAPPAEAAPVAESVAPVEPTPPEQLVAVIPLPKPEPLAPLPEQTKTESPSQPSKDGILEDPEVAGARVAPVMPGSIVPIPTATPRDSASHFFEAAPKKDEILPAAMNPGPPLQPTKTGFSPQRGKVGLRGTSGAPPQQIKTESARDSVPSLQQTKTGFALQATKDRLVGDSGSAAGAASSRLSLVKQPASTPAPDLGAELTFSGLEVDAHSRRRWLLPAAVLAIFGVIAVAGWRLHVARNAGMAKHVPAATAPAPTAAPQPEQVQEVKPAEPAVEPQHSPFSPPPIANMATPSTKAKPAAEAPADVTIRRGPQPVVETAGPLRRPATGTSRAAQAPETQAPQLALSAPELPAPLAKPAPAEVSGPVSRILPARLVHRVEPVYPEPARRLQLSGKVVLKATITKSGTVGSVQWVSGNSLFRDSAITAVKQWQYKAASLNGQPVESDLEISLHFSHPANH